MIREVDYAIKYVIANYKERQAESLPPEPGPKWRYSHGIVHGSAITMFVIAVFAVTFIVTQIRG